MISLFNNVRTYFESQVDNDTSLALRPAREGEVELVREEQ